MPGTVVTFYSYKGGVGRTFILANVATLLARWGFRVLCIDWDLEAPGLAHYFSKWMPTSKLGLIDFLEDFKANGTADWARYVLAVPIDGTKDRLSLIQA